MFGHSPVGMVTDDDDEKEVCCCCWLLLLLLGWTRLPLQKVNKLMTRQRTLNYFVRGSTADLLFDWCGFDQTCKSLSNST